MGVAQKPPGNVPDTEEVTAQTVVPEELVAMMTNPNLDPLASNATDQHAQKDRTSDVGANETPSAVHDAHAERSHPPRTSGVGLSPFAASSTLGIAPLGPPPTSRFGASPLGFASPISAYMPPPEVYGRASRPTPLPVPAAPPEEATPHTPVSESTSSASAASFPVASATHVADDPPPDSGWGSERPTVVAEASSEGDDSLTKIIPASRIALESPGAAADASRSPALGEPDATYSASDTDPAPFAPESIPAVASDASEPIAAVAPDASTELAAAETLVAPVERARFESATFDPVPVERAPGWGQTAAFEHATESSEHATVLPSEMRVLEPATSSHSVASAFEEAGTWSQVPLEASQFTPEPFPRGERANTEDLVAQDEPAPPASGEVLTGSASHGAIETASPVTSEWRGAGATRGATLPGIDLDSTSSDSLATPIYAASALSTAAAVPAVPAAPAIPAVPADSGKPSTTLELAGSESTRETTPEPFARAKLGRTEPPPVRGNGVGNPEGPEPAAFVSDVAMPELAKPAHPAKTATRNQPFSRPPEPIVAPVSRSALPASNVVAAAEPSVVGKSRTSKLTLALWALTVVGAFAGGWHWAGTSNQRRLAAASTSLSTQVLAARESGRAEAVAAIPEPPAILDLSVPSGVKSIGEILRMEPGERTKSEAVALGRQWQAKRFDEFAKLSAELRENPARLDDFKIRVAALEFVQDRLTSRAALELLAEIPSPRALDLLYSVWTGSKERNETTQLAEALLFSKEVRPQVSGALELALALRARPTRCDVIQQLVARSIREGDRRSANQLVATSARRNCGDDGATDCVKCLDDVRDMRKAIRASAMRPEPTP